MSIPVKWFHSTMTGAPQQTGAAGGLIAIFDACLLNGFNVNAIDSLAYDSATGLVTCTVNAGHGYQEHQVVEISGADQNEYNGEQRISVIDSTSFSYIPATAPTITPATGTISAKTPPIGGWEKSFSGTNLAMYKSTGALANQSWLYIDDSGASWPTMRGVKGATAIDAWASEFPASPVDVLNTANREWAIVGDESTIYFMLSHTSSSFSLIHVYGEIDRFNTISDDDATIIGGGYSGVWHSIVQPNQYAFISNAYDSAGMVQVDLLGIGDKWGDTGAISNPSNNEIVMCRDIIIKEHGNGNLRGKLRGCRQPLHKSVNSGSYFAIEEIGGDLYAWMEDMQNGGAVYLPLEGEW